MKYKAKKGNRIKRYFTDIEIIKNNDNESWWFYNDIGKYGQWINGCDETLSKEYDINNMDCSNMDTFYGNYGTLKRALRRIKYTTKYVPKGTKIKICSKYMGHDVIVTL